MTDGLSGTGNLFADVPDHAPEEIFDILTEEQGVKVERIISTGQPTPDGEWYDQAWGEWVILLTGGAGLRFDGEGVARRLSPGDWVFIPPHVRHRVDWTSKEAPTVWLAVHLPAPAPA